MTGYRDVDLAAQRAMLARLEAGEPLRLVVSAGPAAITATLSQAAETGLREAIIRELRDLTAVDEGECDPPDPAPEAIGSPPMADGAHRWRGRLPVPEHCHPLVKRLIAEANAQRTTMTEIADRAGLCRGTISDWRYTRLPRIDLLEAALNVLDLELRIVPRMDR